MCRSSKLCVSGKDRFDEVSSLSETSPKELDFCYHSDKEGHKGGSYSYEHQPNPEYANDGSEQQDKFYSNHFSSPFDSEISKPKTCTLLVPSLACKKTLHKPGRLDNIIISGSTYPRMEMSSHRVFSIRVSGANFHDVFMEKQRILMDKLKYDFVKM
ncbi:unnamed protein product [Phytomonas sp. Hart1]|nr:unnamed protein product [Phytomonas sp. Hart1]|eukprot:CCW65997.1 unnamed protein product [Phytomonas sp. isolate Hart1]